MARFELVTPCHFGLEAVTKREIEGLGYDITRVEDGRVTFSGDEEAVCLSNVFLRSAERVLLQVGRFRAETFDELFDGIRALPWEDFIPEHGKFWVTKASSIKSKLYSPSDVQSIAKKAMVERLKEKYHIGHFPEDGAPYPVRIFMFKDEAVVTLDTSGDSLHKRGYRLSSVIAPLSETLASALIMLTPWKPGRILCDPFCGSGTFPIEAAMLAAHIAPGMSRTFTAQQWTNFIPGKLWDDAFEEARDMVNPDIETDIQGYDIDGSAVRAARENARRAGVDSLIHFQQRPLEEFHHPKKYGFIITNPPYGERMEDKENLPALYRQIGEVYASLDSWSLCMISAYGDAEKYIGRKADKKRKVYNGMIRTDFYQFMGPKPPKRGREANWE
ncbi:MAG: class I SAM-dependent RNA methyltransferase [Clostridiales bacterium]|nr:class I SAM-dependent RNA methyltransferase [Clostridiales bacterium]